MDEIDAQRTISKMYRGKKQRDEYRDLRDEEARQQWVDYYVHTGQLDAARELGWDGEPVGDAEAAPPSEDAEAQAAAKIQAIIRGKATRDDYQDTRDEVARKQWVAYYLSLGDKDGARELGWEEGDDVGEAPAEKPDALLPPPAVPTATSPAVPKLDTAKLSEGPSASEEAGGDDAAGDALTDAQTALAKAEEDAVIFSPRWFGQVWGALTDRGGKPKMTDEAAAIIAQSWARVMLARLAVNDTSRRYKLLQLYAKVEEKNAVVIQRAFRNASMARGGATLAAPVDLVKAASASAPAPAPAKKGPTVAEPNGALAGALYKRSQNFPVYQKRYMRVAGGAIRYRVGDVDGTGGGEEKAVPLDTVTKVYISSPNRYEFVVVTSHASRANGALTLRAETEKQLNAWVNGLDALTSPK